MSSNIKNYFSVIPYSNKKKIKLEIDNESQSETPTSNHNVESVDVNIRVSRIVCKNKYFGFDIF